MYIFYNLFCCSTACAIKNATTNWKKIKKKYLPIVSIMVTHTFEKYIRYSLPWFLSHLIWALQTRDRESQRKSTKGIMGYQCTKYGPCGYFSCFARGDTRKRLEEETEEKTKHHNHKIYARLHPGIDNGINKIWSTLIALIVVGNHFVLILLIICCGENQTISW